MNKNFPYLIELAAMSMDLEDQSVQRDAAEKNGIPGDVFDRAVLGLRSLPNWPQTPQEFVHAIYLLDGWTKGYVGIDEHDAKFPTIWVLGQLADEFYKSE